MIKNKLIKILNRITNKYTNKKIKFIVNIPPKCINFDFSTNIAMLISDEIKKNPIIIANEIKNIILKKENKIIEKIEITKPGFINFKIKNEMFYKKLHKIINNIKKKTKKNNKKKILIEFVSANPTGPLHIGHGRGAAIGDSLSRILKYLGYNVIKEYYLNDTGNQINILEKSVKLRYKQLNGHKIDFPKDYYNGDYIIDIAKKIVKNNINIDKINFRQEAIENITKSIKKDLKEFNVKFDNWFYESKISEKKDKNEKTEVDKICNYLQNKKYAYINKGALWLASTKFGDDKDRVLKRSDGRYTYIASDIAYHKNKIRRNFAKLINIWGVDHHGYVKRIKACINMLGYNKKKIDIILYQLVFIKKNKQSVQMSTRSGEFIKLKTIINEVGKDACRFFFLINSPNSQINFDLTLTKTKSKKNHVFYIQYVNARCYSIIKKSKNFIFKKNKKINFSLLNTEEEMILLKNLAEFDNVVILCAKTMSPHHLVEYLINLADVYHKFYEKHRVLTKNINISVARLELIKGTQIIIKNGLNLLGISSPNKM
ncbi:MAG: arginine--tRNA ligase [Endomicrobium sp.]|nr:arginine--tRNA ligase [Endomicrobium sp.]